VYNNQSNYTNAPHDAWHDTEGGYPRKYRFEGSQSSEGWTNLIPLGGGIMQIGTATTQNSILESFQPGHWYKLVVRAKATTQPGTHTFEFGYTYKENGAWVADIFQTPVTLTQNWATYESQPFFLPVNATDFIPKIRSVKTNQIDWIFVTPLPTYSRVTARTLSSGADNYTYNYTYVNPATNTGTGGHPYDAYHTQFWGHEYVTVTDPYGNATQTHYWQEEPYVGMPRDVTASDSFGRTLQTNVSDYTSSTLCTVVLTDISDKSDPATYLQPYDPLYCRWTYATDGTQTIYQADGSTAAGSLTTAYQYEGTYGNLVLQTVSGSIPHSLTTHYEYYTNTGGGNYIVGLPSHTWIDNGIGTIAETINVFDSNGFLTKTRALMDPGQYSQATFGYDSYGNVTSLTTYSGYATASSDPASGARTASTVYDSIYHTYPISITTPPTDLYPSGLTTTLTYNYSLGVPTSETGPNGAATTVSAEYDSFGRLTKLIRPGDDSASPTLAIQYSSGYPFTTTLTQKIQSGQFYTATRVYDGLGRPTSTTAGGITTLFAYETISEGGHLYRQDKVSTPYASGETYSWARTKYDALGRPLRVTAPDDTISSFEYDGFETTVTDANGNKTTTVTDILGQTLSVTPKDSYGNAFGPNMVFTYNDLGNLTSATRGGAQITMQYDLGGRKTSMSDPDMGNWSYQYDALGNLTSQTDARACTTNLTYDNLNRPTQKTYSNCPATSTVTYGYDSGTYGKGFRTSMSDGSGSTSWTYDYRGRLASESKSITGSSAFVTQWTYNSADLPLTMRYPDNELVTFNYDSRALLNSVIGANTYVSGSTYDSAGRATSRTLGNGLTQTFGYYNWDEKVNNVGQGGRLKTLTTGSLQNLAYQYDAVGNIKQITNSIASETSTYEYDVIYRLTSWTLNGVTETYQYNSTTGNLSNKAGLGLQYNDANHVHAATNANSNAYQYDSNGNQTSRTIGGNNYTLGYDAENRLVSVTGPSLNAQFTYDGDGRRVKSVVNGETILFVGGHFELNDTTNQVTKYYPGGAIRKYIVPQTTTLNYMLGDHLGSTSLATDASGNLLVETRYTPWGEVRYTTPNQTLPTRYTFTGQYSYVNDDATDLGAAGFGLMYYNARWYDNTTGRFAQADTIVPGGVQGLDRFAYVNNNPVNGVDPSGHSPHEDWQKKPNKPKPIATNSTSPSQRSGGRVCDEYLNGECITWDADYILDYFDITVEGGSRADKEAIVDAVLLVAGWLAYIYGEGTFQRTHGPITIRILNEEINEVTGNCGTIGNIITCSQAPDMATIIHEFGHVFDNHSGGAASDRLTFGGDIDDVNGHWSRNTNGFICDTARCLAHPPSMGYWIDDGDGVYEKGELSMQQDIAEARDEQWADLYMNFFMGLYGVGDPNHGFASSPQGTARMWEFLDIFEGILYQ
jgi:RHS repeat-associated protein